MSEVSSSSSSIQNEIASIIAKELDVKVQQVRSAIELIKEGATVPFIARYRKERTGGLDDTQLRTLSKRLVYLEELSDRRASIIKSIDDQDKMTADLKAQILGAATKVELEDIYLPFKPKRRTKATIAREQGLQGLADALLSKSSASPRELAKKFIDKDKGVEDAEAALAGAQNIIIEQMVETPAVVKPVRELIWKQGELVSRPAKGKEKEGEKFEDYFDFSEPLSKMPSHRVLALLRGEKEGVLKLKLDLPEGPATSPHKAVQKICQEFGVHPQNGWLADTAQKAWKSKLSGSVASDSLVRLKERADEDAIKVFSRNLNDLLLAAPAGPKVVMGIDPGIRTGCKVAVVDATGKLLETDTIYPHEPRRDWTGALSTLARMAKQYSVELVSVGNGTASRETDKLVAELAEKMPDLGLTRVIVSEAGASVYSASELAAEEFPNVDVSLRGAVSIARRLQDPLAELVKIEPKAIGVGQYQHDVDQNALAQSLDAVVEDCVNAVGVDVNTASAPLLSRVAGLNATLAGNIVAYRDENGPFKTRSNLKKVARMGPKSFEQCAGFLRIMDGKQPLDGSAVHPEAYIVVERIAKQTGKSVPSLIGDAVFLRTLNPKDFADDQFGVPTVKDILAELEKPGRDPRPTFKTANFMDGVETITDLREDMMLEGVVTNVAAFGAFIDIGVHQDGLVHISQLADEFVSDPHDVVRAGDVVQVRVLDIDVSRKRISLSMKSHADKSDLHRPSKGRNSSHSNAIQPKTKAQTSSDSDSPFAALKSLKI